MITPTKPGNTKSIFPISNKKIAILLVFFGLFILFHKPIQELISDTIVKYLFSVIQSNWYSDIIFYLIAGYSICFLTIKFRRYIPSLNILLLLLFSASIYLFYRISGEPWTYVPFKSLSIFSYADILFLITLVNLSLYLFRKRKTDSEREPNFFISDIPLTDGAKDELGYPRYAKLVAQKIELSNFEKSFAIGINGKWGQGKSSFVNFLRQNPSGASLFWFPSGASVPNTIIKPKRKLCGITCVSSVLPVCNRI